MCGKVHLSIASWGDIAGKGITRLGGLPHLLWVWCTLYTLLQCISSRKDQTTKHGEIHQIYTKIKPSAQQPNCHGPKHLIVSACKNSQNFTVVPLTEFDCWPLSTGPDANMAWPGLAWPGLARPAVGLLLQKAASNWDVGGDGADKV